MTDALELYQYAFDPGTDPKAPILLALHGTGGDEFSLLEFAARLVPGAMVLSPRGNVLERGVWARFFRRFAEGQYDIADAEVRAGQLAAWLAAAKVHHQAEDRPVIAVGYSNGANIAAAMLMLHPSSLAAAALLRPAMPAMGDTGTTALSGVNVLMLVGQHDDQCPPDRGRALGEVLQNRGASVQLRMQRAGHELNQDDVIQLQDWVTQLTAAR